MACIAEHIEGRRLNMWLASEVPTVRNKTETKGHGPGQGIMSNSHHVCLDRRNVVVVSCADWLPFECHSRVGEVIYWRDRTIYRSSLLSETCSVKNTRTRKIKNISEAARGLNIKTCKGHSSSSSFFKSRRWRHKCHGGASSQRWVSRIGCYAKNDIRAFTLPTDYRPCRPGSHGRSIPG